MNKHRVPIWSLLLSITSACAPCGPVPDDQICEPGKTDTCACPDGRQGAQTCDPEGTAWGSCRCEGGSDAGTQDGAVTDSGPTGVELSIGARAVETCGSWLPEHQPELNYQTPANIRLGVSSVELLRGHDDPAPVELALAEPIVEVDASSGGTLLEIDTGAVPEGGYTHVRVVLAWASYEVLATAHQGGSIDGTLSMNMSLSDHQRADSTSYLQGEYVATFTAYSQSFSFTGSTPFNCALSAWGGIAATVGTSFAVRVPLPDAPVAVDHASTQPISIDLVFPVLDIFGWRDADQPDFEAGILDLSTSPGGSEIPDAMVECNLLMADRCISEAVVPAHPTWPMPDSSIDFCTDGVQLVSSCPAEGEPAYGQDTNYSVHPPSLSAQDGVVTDGVTGLSWQQATPSESLDWWHARDYCSALSLGGHSDWRLPSRVELVSLIDFGGLDPVIDLDAFPGALSDFYWTGSPVPFLNMAYGVRFELGFIYDHDPYSTGRVRCVRGDYQAPTPRFSYDVDTVVDNGTGLEWQRAHFPVAMVWTDALAACEELDRAGHTDWRLPTLKEQQTIVDERRLQPCIDVVAFPDTPPEWFWSSTPIQVPPDQGWTTSFTDGYASIHEFTELQLVRCVR